MGILILGIAGIYLLISIAVVLLVVRYARNKGAGAKRWGWGAVLVMWLIPFWDWLPTAAVHQYYCATESGFWVYKTLEQWKTENPGVMEELVAFKDVRSANSAYLLNERFKWVIKRDGDFLFNQWRQEYQIVDRKTEEILGRYIDFYTGNGNIGGADIPMKFWLQSGLCSNSHNQYDHKFYVFRDNFLGEKNEHNF